MTTLVVATLSACGDPPVEPSLLDGPRVLAVRGAIDLTAGTLHLESLTWNADSFVWRSCPTRWLPAPDPVCESEESLGVTATVTVSAPSAETWIRLDAGSAGTTGVPAILSVDPDETIGDIALTAIDVVPDGENQALTPTLSSTENVVVTWYTTAGKITPYRTFGAATATLEAGADPPAEVSVFAVVRGPDGAVDWHMVQVTP
jgi:hypothetical protein